jgi:nucleoid-associated protein YgaU
MTSGEDNGEKRSRGQQMGAGKRRGMGPGRPGAKTRKHVVQSGETLSGLAKKYYGDPGREKWMAIYEANKEVIGDDPDMIQVGMELEIPDLEP